MKIICIGKNYADHAKELNSAVPTKPVFFLKPETSLLAKNANFYYPEFTKNLHHEVELVLKFSKPGKHIDAKFAMNYVNEIGIGIDFTARDLQDEAKKKGLPWEIAKAFDNAAVVSKTFIPLSSINNLNDLKFHLDINGKTVQLGTSKDMVFDIPTLIAYVSQFITFKKGDLFFSGTPAGVGAVQIGDQLEAYIEDKKLLSFKIH